MKKGFGLTSNIGNQELEKQIRSEMEETAQRLTRLEAENKELETSTPKRLPKCKRKGVFSTGKYRCLYCKERRTYQIGRWTCPGCKNTQLNEW
jgi:rubrerythrin